MGMAPSTARDNDEMVDNLISTGTITTKKVELAFRLVDRKNFYPPTFRTTAYNDQAWKAPDTEPLKLHLSAPGVYGATVEALGMKKGLCFLNVGSGTGYLSTVVGFILGRTGTNHAIEINEDVVKYALDRLQETRQLKALDVYEWCPPVFCVGSVFNVDVQANVNKYDRIYIGANVPTTHKLYFMKFLKIGGVAVMPLSLGLYKVKKIDEKTFNFVCIQSVSFANLVMDESEDPEKVVSLPPIMPLILATICKDKIRSVIRQHIEPTAALKMIIKTDKNDPSLRLERPLRRNHLRAREAFLELANENNNFLENRNGPFVLINQRIAGEGPVNVTINLNDEGVPIHDPFVDERDQGNEVVNMDNEMLDMMQNVGLHIRLRSPTPDPRTNNENDDTGMSDDTVASGRGGNRNASLYRGSQDGAGGSRDGLPKTAETPKPVNHLTIFSDDESDGGGGPDEDRRGAAVRSTMNERTTGLARRFRDQMRHLREDRQPQTDPNNRLLTRTEVQENRRRMRTQNRDQIVPLGTTRRDIIPTPTPSLAATAVTARFAAEHAALESDFNSIRETHPLRPSTGRSSRRRVQTTQLNGDTHHDPQSRIVLRQERNLRHSFDSLIQERNSSNDNLTACREALNASRRSLVLGPRQLRHQQEFVELDRQVREIRAERQMALDRSPSHFSVTDPSDAFITSYRERYIGLIDNLARRVRLLSTQFRGLLRMIRSTREQIVERVDPPAEGEEEPSRSRNNDMLGRPIETTPIPEEDDDYTELFRNPDMDPNFDMRSYTRMLTAAIQEAEVTQAPTTRSMRDRDGVRRTVYASASTSTANGTSTFTVTDNFNQTRNNTAFPRSIRVDELDTFRDPNQQREHTPAVQETEGRGSSSGETSNMENIIDSLFNEANSDNSSNEDDSDDDGPQPAKRRKTGVVESQAGPSSSSFISQIRSSLLEDRQANGTSTQTPPPATRMTVRTSTLMYPNVIERSRAIPDFNTSADAFLHSLATTAADQRARQLREIRSSIPPQIGSGPLTEELRRAAEEVYRVAEEGVSPSLGEYRRSGEGRGAAESRLGAAPARVNPAPRPPTLPQPQIAVRRMGDRNAEVFRQFLSGRGGQGHRPIRIPIETRPPQAEEFDFYQDMEPFANTNNFEPTDPRFLALTHQTREFMSVGGNFGNEDRQNRAAIERTRDRLYNHRNRVAHDYMTFPGGVLRREGGAARSILAARNAEANAIRIHNIANNAQFNIMGGTNGPEEDEGAHFRRRSYVRDANGLRETIRYPIVLNPNRAEPAPDGRGNVPGRRHDVNAPDGSEAINTDEQAARNLQENSLARFSQNFQMALAETCASPLLLNFIRNGYN
uniref:Protein-L-isoaspartate O-methyltransferase domain-containing protein 1 n=1 Tax=Rhabditophanes sp. KR3021 TaxID=114890 RepID=A0AC35UAU0_9BILA